MFEKGTRYVKIDLVMNLLAPCYKLFGHVVICCTAGQKCYVLHQKRHWDWLARVHGFWWQKKTKSREKNGVAVVSRTKSRAGTAMSPAPGGKELQTLTPIASLKRKSILPYYHVTVGLPTPTIVELPFSSPPRRFGTFFVQINRVNLGMNLSRS